MSCEMCQKPLLGVTPVQSFVCLTLATPCRPLPTEASRQGNLFLIIPQNSLRSRVMQGFWRGHVREKPRLASPNNEASFRCRKGGASQSQSMSLGMLLRFDICVLPSLLSYVFVTSGLK
jgi:hypothetical protein